MRDHWMDHYNVYSVNILNFVNTSSINQVSDTGSCEPLVWY
jgi:hypothetical protein